MDTAVDRSIISKLFIQEWHRNASVILLSEMKLQAPFRCPADRRQIGIMTTNGNQKHCHFRLLMYVCRLLKAFSIAKYPVWG